jgi:Leucine-rich repeat (LRR) protein
MTSLLYFYVDNNSLLSGSIPSCIGNLTFLHELHASCDSLNGTIPTGFNTLAFLTELRLQCNANLDCTSALATKPNFVFLCGTTNFNCAACPAITPVLCPVNITVPNCGIYVRQV